MGDWKDEVLLEAPLDFFRFVLGEVLVGDCPLLLSAVTVSVDYEVGQGNPLPRDLHLLQPDDVPGGHVEGQIFFDVLQMVNLVVEIQAMAVTVFA